MKAGAKQFAANVLPVIREIQSGGAKTNAAIAAKLNERKVGTARGGRWSHVQVGAVLERGGSPPPVSFGTKRYPCSGHHDQTRG